MPESSKRKIAYVAILALTFVITSGFPLVAADKSASTSLKGFKTVKIAPGQSKSDRVINLLLPYVGDHPESVEGRPELDLSIRRHENALIFDLKLGGYLDDSVSGEHYRGSIVGEPGAWELVDLGVKYICYRGMSDAGKCL